MGSMGLLLADWSVELFRARRKRARKAKVEQGQEPAGCRGCEELGEEVRRVEERRSRGEEQQGRLATLVGVETCDLVAAVEELVTNSAQLRAEAERLREEGVRMAEGVGRQLADRDQAHGERVRALETLMTEKEKQLLQSSNLLRQQLAQGKKEREQLQRRLEEEGEERRREQGEEHSAVHWEQEVHSLRQVLDIRREEAEQLKAANNSLLLELERCHGLEARLQVQQQRAEELGLVVAMKNDQLRQVLDEYDSVQQQLEVEVSAHLACQQELERSQWVADTILSPDQQSPAKEKRWKNISNQVESGLILDVVQKGEKGVAYSFNC